MCGPAWRRTSIRRGQLQNQVSPKLPGFALTQGSTGRKGGRAGLPQPTRFILYMGVFRRSTRTLGVEPHLWCNSGRNSVLKPRRFFFMFFLVCFVVIGMDVMLYSRGRPTSVVLLLLMIVPKLSLPLGRHSPLGLHHLLRLVRAARGLVPLGCVEVLQVRGLVRTTHITAEVGGRVRAGVGAGHSAGV